MKNSHFLILFLLALNFPFTFAQTANLRATGKGYDKAQFTVFTYSDPVTLQLLPLIKFIADGSGIISANIPVTSLTQVVIKSGIYSFRLFMQPGKVYELSLPEYKARTNSDLNNPFFQETELLPKIKTSTVSTPDLNTLINDFDRSYNQVYDSISSGLFFNVTSRASGMQKEKLNIYPVTDTLEFYSTYVRCKKSVLDLMTIKQLNEKYENTKYLNEEYDLTNPACTQLIFQVYNDYLKQLTASELKTEIVTAINKGSFSDLRNTVIKHNKMAEGELLDYVLLLNLYNEFFSGSFKKGNIIKTISDANTYSSNSEIKSISGFVLERVTRFLPGNLFPLKPLVNSEGDSVLMSDYTGKYILLNLARSDSYSTLQEFSIVKMWQGRYDDDLKIITILTDNDFGTGVAKLRKADYNWELLDGSNDDGLISFFDVRILPAFYLFDRDGRILMATSLLPSEQLEKLIYEKIQNDKIRSGLLK